MYLYMYIKFYIALLGTKPRTPNQQAPSRGRALLQDSPSETQLPQKMQRPVQLQLLKPGKLDRSSGLFTSVCRATCM